MKAALPFFALFVLTDCRDVPTGVELLERADSAQRQLSTGEMQRASLFLMEVRPWLSEAQLLEEFTLRMDGRDLPYTGFVYERVAVRADPHDGYPCPLARRTFVGWPKDWDGTYKQRGWEFVSVVGADFALPISRESDGCAAFDGMLPTRPVVRWFGSSGGSRLQGVQGRASIRPMSSPASRCKREPFLDTLIRTECETGQFEVELAAEMATARRDTGAARADSVIRLEILPQRFPGFRVRVYCDTAWNTRMRQMEGCVWHRYDDSVKVARLCHLDSLHNDTLRELAVKRGDNVEQWPPTWPPPCPWIEWVKQERAAEKAGH